MPVTVLTVTISPLAPELLVPAKFSTAFYVAVSSATNPFPLKLFGIATVSTAPEPEIERTIHFAFAPEPDVVPSVTMSPTAYPVPLVLTYAVRIPPPAVGTPFTELTNTFVFRERFKAIAFLLFSSLKVLG